MQSRNAILLVLVLATVLEAGCAAAAPSTIPPPPALPTSAQAGGTSIVAIAPPAQPCCPKQTLPQFLGITGLFKGIGGLLNRLRNRLGSRFPGLEAKPELLAITDPANLDSANPAVAEAAAVKAEEDAAAQKIKAIRYLASIGCTDCYPDVEDALLAALDDCTEAVRYEAVVGLREVAGNPCKNCRSNSCCSPKIIAKLEKMANKSDAQGCPFEPSDRVRRVARLAISACGSSVAVAPPAGPLEGPAGEPTPAAPPAATATRIERSIVVPANVALASATAEASANVNATLSFDEVLSHYQSAPPPAAKAYEVRWERIAAPLGSFRSPQDALAVMTLLRTRALGAMSDLPPGMSLAGVTTQSFAWTNSSGAGSASLGHALSNTPIGGVSQVFEENGMLQMVRILERRPVAVTPVAEPAATGAALEPATAKSAIRRATQRLPACDCEH